MRKLKHVRNFVSQTMILFHVITAYETFYTENNGISGDRMPLIIFQFAYLNFIKIQKKHYFE